ncbi:MAG TPA: hypothetical protein PKW33_03895 [Anaerolineaceae bacterium]|nr:hypothetical protein [Anaerolineaceae bacterium]HPN50704.1 hypothetical protein [Anaerolineaceae bacterium]
MDWIFTPPVAFLIYIPLVLIIERFGRALAGPGSENAAKSSLYGSGEEAPTMPAAPGYRPFFLIAFFFAILHLGVLVLGTGSLTNTTAAYILGLSLALMALILG